MFWLSCFSAIADVFFTDKEIDTEKVTRKQIGFKFVNLISDGVENNSLAASTPY